MSRKVSLFSIILPPSFLVTVTNRLSVKLSLPDGSQIAICDLERPEGQTISRAEALTDIVDRLNGPELAHLAPLRHQTASSDVFTFVYFSSSDEESWSSAGFATIPSNVCAITTRSVADTVGNERMAELEAAVVSKDAQIMSQQTTLGDVIVYAQGVEGELGDARSELAAERTRGTLTLLAALLSITLKK